MDTRQFAALELAARAKIARHGDFWLVPSLSHNGSHRVNGIATVCSCEDYELHGHSCKHMLAVRLVIDRERGRIPPASAAEPVAKPPRKTYRQDWPNYNRAQTGEKRQFLGLLSDLCGTVPEPPPAKTGRPRVPLADALFAAVFKVYSTVSGRRFMCDLEDARDKGHVGRAPHYNSIFRVLEDETVTPILRKLVADSAAPLAAVESAFAVDSSGFGTSRFIKWFDTKHGVERRQADWVKTHICIGVKTNVVTAVEIGDAHDSRMFAPLVTATAERFTLGEVTADKAYSGRPVLELVESLGGVPYIPFKSRTLPNKNGETWRRLWHFFQLNRAEFVARYHQRSNVESTFSMVKRKFGDAVRSKTPTAMTNEVLCKLLCHNLVVLIHETHELGIDVGFGSQHEDEASTDDEPRLLRFPGA